MNLDSKDYGKEVMGPVGAFLDIVIQERSWDYGIISLVDILCRYEDFRQGHRGPAHTPKPEVTPGTFAKREFRPNTSSSMEHFSDTVPYSKSPWKDHE